MLKKLCHERGLRLMIEPYDMNPAGDLDLGSYADFPAGEFWHDTFESGWSCMTAASIAHTLGTPVVLAEAFTSGRGNWQRFRQAHAGLRRLGLAHDGVRAR